MVFCTLIMTLTQAYSNGLSEIILGNAIKKLELPRDELVIMTKVRILSLRREGPGQPLTSRVQVYAPIPKDHVTSLWAKGINPEDVGIINQKGLSRKVRILAMECLAPNDHVNVVAAHL